MTVADEPEDGGTYTWVTKSGTIDSGSAAEMFIALHLGSLRYAGYDPDTGLYWYVPRKPQP